MRETEKDTILVYFGKERLLIKTVDEVDQEKILELSADEYGNLSFAHEKDYRNGKSSFEKPIPGVKQIFIHWSTFKNQNKQIIHIIINKLFGIYKDEEFNIEIIN